MSAQTQYENACEASHQRDIAQAQVEADRIDELLNGELDPDSMDMSSEAMSEASALQKAAYKQAMQSKDFLLAGEIIHTLSHAYCLQRAEQIAVEEIGKARDRDAADAAYERRAA